MYLQDSDSDSDSDDDDDKKGSDWASEEEDSDSDEGGAYAELKGRARWLKKNTVGKEKVVKSKEERAKARAEAKAAAAAARSLEAVQVTKTILPEAHLTPSVLNRKVKEIAAQRGRRGTDNRQVLRQLEALWRLSLRFGPRVEIPILMFVVTAQFDLQRTMDDFMDTITWKSCASYLQRIASVLDDGYTLGLERVEEGDLVLGTATGKMMKASAAAVVAEKGAMAAVAVDEALINPHTGESETEDERAERLRLEAEEKMTDAEKKTIPVVGSLSLFLTRLEEEYTKSLQKISPHTAEYVVRLRDESKLVELLARVQAYYERIGKPDECAALAQLRIEHIYYRHDSIARQVDKAAEFYETFGEVDMLHPACVTNDNSGKGSEDFSKTHPGAASGMPVLVKSSAENTDWTTLMSKLCTYVYKHGNDRARIRAMICHIYHHALHDRFLDARDLLLMSHLQENIYYVGDVSTMILFNRMMVTLGMSAFRLGRIWDSHQCLAEVCSGRVRELLAQGVSTGRFSDKTVEQEKAEKRRQVPYHQHINLDLLEASHLISAMLLEVPNMAAASVDGSFGSTRRARVISRTFRKHHDIYDRQVFTGPPEQTRDFVMRAAKALEKGDWKTCSDLVANLDVWRLVPGENAAAEIRTMLTSKIKLEALRTYLFAFSAQYDSLSLGQLCGMFDMTKTEVHSVVSKMMINRELYASWDQPTETIVLRKVEPSSLQVMALQFAEKAASLVEANERLLDAQSGTYGYKDEYWKSGESDGRFGGRGDRFHRGGGGGNRFGGGRGGGGGGHRGGDGGGGGHGNRPGGGGGNRPGGGSGNRPGGGGGGRGNRPGRGGGGGDQYNRSGGGGGGGQYNRSGRGGSDGGQYNRSGSGGGGGQRRDGGGGGGVRR
jgi:translation initiation factor 3 subunit C